MHTERALITEDDNKPSSRNQDSPKRVVATDMPVLNDMETEQDSQENEKQVEIKFSKETDNNDDFLQIEDQDSQMNLSKKSVSKPATG